MHYHGTPLTPRAQLLELAGCCFCVPYPRPEDVVVCHEIGQSVMLDNGAYSFWQDVQRGRRERMPDWPGYYAWCEPWLDYRTTWAIIPDVIDGGAEENDALVAEWPHGDRGAPVWHMHEPIDRLLRLADRWPRVCIGSSGEYAGVGSSRWHGRLSDAMDQLCGNGPAPVWLHLLRGTAFAGSEYPFASVDSTGIARNHAGAKTAGRAPKDVRALARVIDALQCSPRWRVREPQMELA
jgi:hypothetical protein